MSLILNPAYVGDPGEFPEDLDPEIAQVLTHGKRDSDRPTQSTVPLDHRHTRLREDGFHISGDQFSIDVVDPGHLSTAGRLVRELLARGKPHYTAEQERRPILPERLLEDLSLIAKDDFWYPTLSALLKFDEATGTVELDQLSLTQSQVEEDIDLRRARAASGDPSDNYHELMRGVNAISRVLKGNRKLLTELFQDSNHVPVKENLGVQDAIARLMIFFNTEVTAFARAHKIPVLHLNQQPIPTTGFQRRVVSAFRKDPEHPRTIRNLKAIFSDLEFENSYSPKPRGHFGLNRKAYAVFSNPLRDASAFVNMCNVSAFLRGEPFPYSREDLTLLGNYLTLAETGRGEFYEKNAQRRMQKLIDDETASFEFVSTRDFRVLVELVAKLDTPPAHVSQEIHCRLDGGSLDSAEDQISILGAPRYGAPGWKDIRMKCLKRVKYRDPYQFLRMSLRKNEDWDSIDFKLVPGDYSWQAWVTASIDGEIFTIPQKLHLTSANVAADRSALLFWEHFIQGTLLSAKEPTEVVESPVQCPHPKSFELPEEPPTEVDPMAADLLHITSSVGGLGTPQFVKIPEGPEGSQTHTTVIHGMTAVPAPIVGDRPMDHAGRATNLAAGHALHVIRRDLGIEEMTEAAIWETRRRKWRNRVLNNLNFNRPRQRSIDVETEFRPITQLMRVCRKNRWPEPLTEEVWTNVYRVTIKIGDKEVTATGKSDFSNHEAIDIAAEKILKQLPEFFESSADRQALTRDKRDPSTPLGLLTQLADTDTSIFTFGNQHFRILVKATAEVRGEVFHTTSASVETESERIAMNVAAQELLKRIAASHPDLLPDDLPKIPEEIEDNEIIPLGFLALTEPVKELQLVCQQQGHGAPKYHPVFNVGKKRRGVRYECEITTAEGDVIRKTATSGSAKFALQEVTEYMLRHLVPAYRGAPIFSRKAALLATQHGMSISEPAYEVERVDEENENSKTVIKCSLDLTIDDGKVITGVAHGRNECLALNNASAWLLERFWMHVKHLDYLARKKAMGKRAPKKRRKRS